MAALRHSAVPGTIGNSTAQWLHGVTPIHDRVITMPQSVARSRFKIMACSECGKPMTVGSNKRKAPRHIECSIRIAAETQYQISQKSGPRYEAWRKAMLKHLDAG